MRYFLCFIMLLGLSNSFAGTVKKGGKSKVTILIPGTRYCGPGNVGGKPNSKLDAACKRHDESKGYKQSGVTKYIPGLGNAQVQKADQRLIRDAARVIASKNATVKEKIYAGATGSYFAAKNRADQAANQKRKKYQRTKIIYAKAKAAVKARFNRARKVYRAVKNRTKNNRYTKAKAAIKNRLNQTRRRRIYQSSKNRTRSRYTRTKAALKRRFRRRRR